MGVALKERPADLEGEAQVRDASANARYHGEAKSAFDDPVGIDLGVARAVPTSDGTQINPRTDDALDERANEMRQSMSRKRLKKRRSRAHANERRRLTRLTRRVANRRKDDCQRFARAIAQSHTPVAFEGMLIKNMMRSAYGTARKPCVGCVEEAQAEPVDTQGGLVAVPTLSGVCLRHGENVLPRCVGGRRVDNVFRARIRGQARPVEPIEVRLSGPRSLRERGRERGAEHEEASRSLVFGAQDARQSGGRTHRCRASVTVVPKTRVGFARLTPE